MSTESDKSPNGVCSFVFYFLFWRFLHGLFQMARSSKIQKNKRNPNCRPHVHRVRQEPQWGLQFCFFLIFEVFAWSAPDGQNLENQKKQKNKTADHMSTESDKSLIFFVFSRFLHGLLCCILLLSHQIALYSAKSI